MAENVLEQSELLAIEKPVSRIPWGGIFIGAIATLAIGILLHALGAAIGLTAINPAQGEWGGRAGLWTGLWSFVGIVLATFLGAWVAARASTVFFKRDGATLGFMSWALSFLVMLFFVASAAGSATTQLASSSVQAAGEAGAAAQGSPIQQQVQQGAQQLQQESQQAGGAGQVAEQASEVGAAAGWWFFVTALCAMGAGVIGGIAGTPKSIRHGRQLEVRRTAGLRTRETTV